MNLYSNIKIKFKSTQLKINYRIKYQYFKN